MKDKQARADIREMELKVFGGDLYGFSMADPILHKISLVTMVADLLDRVIKLENQCMRPEKKGGK